MRWTVKEDFAKKVELDLKDWCFVFVFLVFFLTRGVEVGRMIVVTLVKEENYEQNKAETNTINRRWELV